ncbi:hypothetical protein PHYC_03471 [Phycisphaerales bacterium]|nr:hypothetical protein PHYC_03471 [Phycisphaerales bacterium]
MDALAAQVQGLVRPGMPAVLARRALDDLGIKHSEVKPSAADDSFLDGEKFGMIAMIRHEAWQVVTRDVLIRVYFDADSLVTRVETRDVFTGP